MPQPCKICKHPQREAIDTVLIEAGHRRVRSGRSAVSRMIAFYAITGPHILEDGVAEDGQADEESEGLHILSRKKSLMKRDK